VNDITEDKLRKQSFRAASAFGGNSDSIPWPEGDFLRDSFPIEINQAQLDSAVAYAFAEPDPARKRRTRAVVVVYDGKLVAERYAPGYHQHSLMHGWSMAKSFVSTFIGILVREGRLTVKDPAPVDAWKGDARKAITIEHLLQQTSGLDFVEDYSRFSDVTNMLFNKGDMAAYAESRPLKHSPGTVFNYSSGNSNILSKIIRQEVGDSEYYSFPSNRLFQKMGMRSVLFEPDASGTLVMSSYVFATARDYARFGLLYCNGGKWNGEQILPEGWAEQTRQPAPVNSLKNYGYQFRLNGKDNHPPHASKFPDVPADLLYADGYAYQEIYIIPSKKLVVVRLGLTLDRSFDENAFLKDILASLSMDGRANDKHAGGNR
jgi:CubicO group peptidase (beta-lactamase class C family)